MYVWTLIVRYSITCIEVKVQRVLGFIRNDWKTSDCEKRTTTFFVGRRRHRQTCFSRAQCTSPHVVLTVTYYYYYSHHPPNDTTNDTVAVYDSRENRSLIAFDRDSSAVTVTVTLLAASLSLLLLLLFLLLSFPLLFTILSFSSPTPHSFLTPPSAVWNNHPSK